MKVYVETSDIDVLDDLFEATNSYECWACNRDDDLELVSLSDYTKQVRKEVCEEIRELAKNGFEFLICDECYNTIDKDVYISSVALTEILDQIQGE